MLDDSRSDVIESPPRQRGRRRAGLLLLLLLFAILIGGGTALSYYVDALWFGSLGYVDVFWKTLNLQSAIFSAFAIVTFLALYGSFLALKPARFGALGSDEFLIINGRPVRLPVGPVLRGLALIVSLLIALGTGVGMMADWPTLALWWYGRAAQLPAAAAAADRVVDPIFGRPIGFYLFTLPAWERIAGWLTTLAVLMLLAAIFFALVSGGTDRFRSRTGRRAILPGARGLALAWAFVLLMLAVQVWLGRFERLFDDHTIFAGVTYTEAHITLTGMLVVSIALAIGAAIAALGAIRGPRLIWLAAAILPAAVVSAWR